MHLASRVAALVGLLHTAAPPVAPPPAAAGPASGTAPPFPGPTSAFLMPVGLAQFNFVPYELTNASLGCTRPSASVLYTCTIQFGWFDPNSVKENNVTSCSCSYAWRWDGSTPTPGANNTFDGADFLVCADRYPSVFEMRVNAFTGPSNLTLFMSHFYKDSTLWGAPYLYAQTWAMPVLNLTLQSRDDDAMNYTVAGPILANITGLQG